MKARVFYETISIDPSSSRREANGLRFKELDDWLKQNPRIKVKHLVQSQSYTDPTPMFCGTLRIATTVLYEE